MGAKPGNTQAFPLKVSRTLSPRGSRTFHSVGPACRGAEGVGEEGGSWFLPRLSTWPPAPLPPTLEAPLLAPFFQSRTGLSGLGTEGLDFHVNGQAGPPGKLVNKPPAPLGC